MFPNDAPICNNLGYALEKAGRLPEALAQYQRALVLQPGTAVISNNIARVRGKLAGGG
jgi:Flp pilus assembly protein TadD